MRGRRESLVTANDDDDDLTSESGLIDASSETECHLDGAKSDHKIRSRIPKLAHIARKRQCLADVRSPRHTAALPAGSGLQRYHKNKAKPGSTVGIAHASLEPAQSPTPCSDSDESNTDACAAEEISGMESEPEADEGWALTRFINTFGGVLTISRVALAAITLFLFILAFGMVNSALLFAFSSFINSATPPAYPLSFPPGLPPEPTPWVPSSQ